MIDYRIREDIEKKLFYVQTLESLGDAFGWAWKDTIFKYPTLNDAVIKIKKLTAPKELVERFYNDKGDKWHG